MGGEVRAWWGVSSRGLAQIINEEDCRALLGRSYEECIRKNCNTSVNGWSYTVLSRDSGSHPD